MSRPTSRRSAPQVALALTLAVTVLSGCGFKGARSIPLPGGEGQGDDAYKLTIEFQDVLDLVEQSAVKVDDVTVGSVESIEVAEDFTARVVVRVNPEVELPANSTASIRQTSLLGEKFVSLDAPPASEARGQLEGGETISLDQTTRSADIEEVLSALSLVLNGGSLEQIQVINREIVAALEGREDRVKSALNQLDAFVGGLDEQKGQIVRALDSLDRLSARLVTDRQTIATALEDIPAGVEVLTEQREELTEVLTSLDELGDVAVRVIEQSKDNTVADLRALQPILAQLNEAGDAFPRSLELLTTYPFPRTVFEGIKGDYANLFVTLDLDARQIAEAEGIPLPPGVFPSPSPSSSTAPPQAPRSPGGGDAPSAPVPAPAPLPSPTTSGGPGLPGLPPITRDGPLLSQSSSGLLRLLMGGLA
jgi:phospholipid/cholesterol/gamma-HCH transport system substrate-binding protein